MGRKQVPGLIKRGQTWHIDKRIYGRRICQSAGTASLEEAERYLAKLTEDQRLQQHYGIRPSRSFEEAAARFVIEHSHKRSIDSDVGRLKGILPWIARLPIDQVHMGTLQPWLESRRRNDVSAGTINHGLQVIRRILNLASSDWIDENGLTWLHAAPTIRMLPNRDKRKPYPLDWDEQTKLFQLLPKHLMDMALFAVNTGCRDSEICGLRWDWEVKVATLNTSVFLIPADRVKNGRTHTFPLSDQSLDIIAILESMGCSEFLFVADSVLGTFKRLPHGFNQAGEIIFVESPRALRIASNLHLSKHCPHLVHRS